MFTLSGCETLLPNIRPVDDHLSLGGCLLCAGAATVVGSLWPVHDVLTWIMMAKFYICFHHHMAKPADAMTETWRWLKSRENRAEKKAFILNLFHQAKTLCQEEAAATTPTTTMHRRGEKNSKSLRTVPLRHPYGKALEAIENAEARVDNHIAAMERPETWAVFTTAGAWDLSPYIGTCPDQLDEPRRTEPSSIAKLSNYFKGVLRRTAL